MSQKLNNYGELVLDQQTQNFMNNLENKHDMTILFLCEGGSRGWGTYTNTSDSDYRGIYISNSYLKVKFPEPVLSNFVVDTNIQDSKENQQIRKQQGDKSQECDYIFLELSEYLRRRNEQNKTDFNFPLKMAKSYINKFPQKQFQELIENQSIPILHKKGHLRTMYGIFKKNNFKNQKTKEVLNFCVFGLQYWHMVLFQEFPKYNIWEQINYMKSKNLSNEQLESLQKIEQIMKQLYENKKNEIKIFQDLKESYILQWVDKELKINDKNVQPKDIIEPYTIKEAQHFFDICLNLLK